jgi:hypothetical protein
MFNNSGIGITVECANGLIHVRASAPPSLFVLTFYFIQYFKIQNSKAQNFFKIS